MKFEYDGDEIKVSVGKYINGNLAVILWDVAEDEEYGTLTVNLGNRLANNQAYVDTNNLPKGVIKALEEKGVMSSTGKTGQSGFCEYPLYEFNMAILDKE